MWANTVGALLLEGGGGGAVSGNEGRQGQWWEKFLRIMFVRMYLSEPSYPGVYVLNSSDVYFFLFRA